MRADLHHDVEAVPDQVVDGGCEQDRLPHVAPPVFGIELRAIHRLAGDRRDERDPGRLRAEAVQGLAQRRFDRVHDPAVERVGKVQLGTGDAHRGQLIGECLQLGPGA